VQSKSIVVVTATNLPIVEFQLIMPNPLAISVKMRLIRLASFPPLRPINGAT
jgi:hypothetical protein